MSLEQNYTFFIGETWAIPGVVRDANGNIVDITGATIRLRVTLSNSVIFDLVGTIPTPYNGAYNFTITPDQQTVVTMTTYQLEIKAWFADGSSAVQSTGEIVVLPSKFVSQIALTESVSLGATPS